MDSGSPSSPDFAKVERSAICCGIFSNINSQPSQGPPINFGCPHPKLKAKHPTITNKVFIAADFSSSNATDFSQIQLHDQLLILLDELQDQPFIKPKNHVLLGMSRFLKYKADHILFWSLTVFFHGYTQLDLIKLGGAFAFVLEILIRNGLLALAIYLILLKAIPKLTSGKVLEGMSIATGSLVLNIVMKNFHDKFMMESILRQDGYSFFHRTIYNASIVVFYAAFASTLYLSKQWFLQREEIRKIEVEKLNTELNYLRAQMNPHFLFNSINTIFFQIDKQNTAARETLNKFSDLLRYQLYECNRPEISIERELHYLKNYIDLQRLRLNENFKIALSVDDSLRDFSLPPLLLLPFVENAFKHVSHYSERPNEILIHLIKKEHQLSLTVRNTREESVGPSQDGGIGLVNIKRRLNLLYKQQHGLVIHKEADHFEVILNIPVA